jgi:hypothetical protein
MLQTVGTRNKQKNLAEKPHGDRKLYSLMAFDENWHMI